MTKTYYLYIEQLDIEVDCDCEISEHNDGIGYYEYWGSEGYDDGDYYYEVDDITWDRSLYHEEVNNYIDQYIKDNQDKIFKDILKSFNVNDYL